MADPVAVTFLGGLGEIGRNCTVIETRGRRVLLDCGQMFPGYDLPGVHSVLPDFDWLLSRSAPNSGVEACVVTHAHEDHIGALPHLLRQLRFPIYGSPFTLALVRHKLDEEDLLGRAELRPVSDGDHFRAGPFRCEALPVTHSIPGGLITAFTTPQGVILHSSDFKLDLTPVDGRRTALARIGAISDDPGVRLLLADSTNAEEPGSSRSESDVGPVLHRVIVEQQGRRVIVGAFASHIHRIQQIADSAVAAGRTVATLGLSMRRNVALARGLGLLKIPDASICDIAQAADLDPARVLVVCTGSQGEPRAAITQMSLGVSKWVEINDRDTVIFSSHPIPGNGAAVAGVRNRLSQLGARVIHSGHLPVHTSGHGKRQELGVLHSVAAPDWFVPVHGEHPHLAAHARLAEQIGMSGDRVVLCTDGDRIEITDEGLSKVGSVGGDPLYVDGTVGDIGRTVLDDRRTLRDNGFVAVLANVSLDDARIVSGPDVVSRGWAEQPAVQDHEKAVAAAVAAELRGALQSGWRSIAELQRLARRATGRTVKDRTGRRPMIIPVVREA